MRFCPVRCPRCAHYFLPKIFHCYSQESIYPPDRKSFRSCGYKKTRQSKRPVSNPPEPWVSNLRRSYSYFLFIHLRLFDLFVILSCILYRVCISDPICVLYRILYGPVLCSYHVNLGAEFLFELRGKSSELSNKNGRILCRSEKSFVKGAGDKIITLLL